jgi:hypothetical protein
VEAVAAGDHVALELPVGAVVAIAHARALRIEAVHRHVVDLEQEREPRVEPRGDQVLHDLRLAVDDDRAAGQLLHRHVVPLAAELEVDAPVDDPVGVHPRAHAGVPQQVGGALLEHAGADALLDVLAAAALEDDRLDPLAGEQLRERQAGGPGADDADLRAHLRTGTDATRSGR